jgi:hypothetical protein
MLLSKAGDHAIMCYRDELLLRTVLALPNASNTGLDYAIGHNR